MATHKQRREAARRKLERHIRTARERQHKKALIKKITLYATALVVAVIVIGCAGTLWYQHEQRKHQAEELAQLNKVSVVCNYDPSPNELQVPHSKPGKAPENQRYPNSGTLHGVFTTSQGVINFTLDRAKAPCAVESFSNLINQKYFDGTSCHRQVHEQSNTGMLTVIQCGDPTATGMSGPGFKNPSETPLNLADAPASPNAPAGMKIYPKGTIALAGGSSPMSNDVIVSGSQFFIVQHDSYLPAVYPIIGQVDAPSFPVLDTIDKHGVFPMTGSNQQTGEPIYGTTVAASGDGKPAQPVIINSAVITK